MSSNLTVTNLSYNRGYDESILTVRGLTELHSGDWKCTVGLERSKSVSVLVITSATKLCRPFVSETSRGTYKWSVALGGYTLKQPCERLPQGSRSGYAYHFCRMSGQWAANVNTTQCAYTSEVTDTLYKFATMNTSFDSRTLLESAKHFLNYTGSTETFKDPMDVVYFSMAVENYMPYLTRLNDPSVGHYMMDMIANVLGVDNVLMSRAQRRGVAGRRLLEVIENVTAVVPTFRHHTEKLAVERFLPTPYDGLTCTWYSTDTPNMVTEYQRFQPKRVFHCSQTNKTLPSKGKLILASVVVPVTLYQQIQRRSDPTYPVTSHLTFAAFGNATLFPSQPNMPSDYDDVDTFVVGAALSGTSGHFNLTEPVYVVIRGSDEATQDPIARRVQPVWWDAYANSGLGGWTPDPCQLISARANLVWFSCSRLGYYGYRVQKARHSNYYINKHKIDFGYRPHHPIVYAASVICALLITVCIVVYALCHAFITMSRKLQHALVNVWFCFCWILFLFVTGMHQTEHQLTCRFVGLLVHFLTLSSLLWILVGAHIVYTKVTQPPARQQEVKVKKPVARFYMFGYGVSLIVVAVSGAVDMHYYTTKSHCFLKFAPFVGAAVVPSAVASALTLGFALTAYCVLCTAPSHVTEQIEFDVFGGGGGRYNPNTGSLLSLASVRLSDAEKSAKSLLAAIVSLLVLFVCTWSFGALSVVQPFEEGGSQQEVVFGVMYAMSCVSLGVFVLVYFLISRTDVQRCWSSLYDFFKNGKNFREMAGDNENNGEGIEETSNLVHVFPKPQMPGDNNFQFPNQIVPYSSGDNCYNNDVIHPGFQGGVRTSSKKPKSNHVFKNKDSDEVSSDHLSVNNVNHLRRGYIAPVNSEADYATFASKFGPKPSINPSLKQPSTSTLMATQSHPKTSSPAGSAAVPFETHVSPLVAAGADPYSIIPLKDGEVRMGDPCQIASYSTADFPSGISNLVPSSVYGTPAAAAGGSKSASLPRRPLYPRKHRRQREEDKRATDMDDLHSGRFSAVSASSSRSAAVAQKPRRRRRTRKKKDVDPVYKNMPQEDDDYQGDDDLQDEPCHEPLMEQSLEEAAASAAKDESSASQYSTHSRFSTSDIPKRETSV